MPGGRPQNKELDILNFKLIKRQLFNGAVKYKALCLGCNFELSNTSKSRLHIHRNICKNGNSARTPKESASDRRVCQEKLKTGLETVIAKSQKIPERKSTSGRKQNDAFASLNFKLRRRMVNGKRSYKALCLECNTELTNTAKNRLLQHRKSCCGEGTLGFTHIEITESDDDDGVDDLKESIHLMGKGDLLEDFEDIPQVKGVSNKIKVKDIEELIGEGNSNIEIEYIDVARSPQKGPAEPTIDSNQTKKVNDTSVKDSYKAISKSDLPKIVLKGQVKSYLTKRKVKKFTNHADVEEDKRIEHAIANFFVECNLPFSIIESEHFKNFIRALRPDYADKLYGKQEAF